MNELNNKNMDLSTHHHQQPDAAAPGVDHQLLAQRQHTLAAAAAQLKAELVGIDDVIDRVIDAVRAWYVLPQLISRPVIVCLWGLTGTGKTQLTRRLAQLLGFYDRFVEVQMDGFSHGASYRSSSISGMLADSGIHDGGLLARSWTCGYGRRGAVALAAATTQWAAHAVPRPRRDHSVLRFKAEQDERQDVRAEHGRSLHHRDQEPVDGYERSERDADDQRDDAADDGLPAKPHRRRHRRANSKTRESVPQSGHRGSGGH